MEQTIEQNSIKRYDPDIDTGLLDEQVKERIEQNLVNFDLGIKTKSIKCIIRDNLCTLFNLLNFILALAVFIVGSYKNLLFMGVVVCNTIIGTYQEIKAKRAVDKLSIVSSLKAKVLRNSKIIELNPNEIVLDDILILESGNQIVSDCIVEFGEIYVNESLLTGESDLVRKQIGDKLYSGSFVTGGSCKAKVEHIGKDNYANEISNEAKYIKKINSEIMSTINKIIRIVSVLIVPIGIFLFYSQVSISANNYHDAVINTVAALIGMIPEGLVLLTSTVLAVGVIRLSKHKVLVQELYCIETLARVDVMCLDKTGTLTESDMTVSDVIPVLNASKEEVDRALNSLVSALKDNNATFNALKKMYDKNTEYTPIKVVPFRSEKKWSGVSFKKIGTYIIGAPEFILKNVFSEKEEVSSILDNYMQESRVILLAHTLESFNEDMELPQNLEVKAIIIIDDKIRKEAKKTLEYFESQDVDIKVISGDNVLTVFNIARSLNIKNYDKYIDATTLEDYDQIKDAVKKYTLFGRVSPKQKKQIVLALKEDKKTVAMIGDGVNDVLALKEADCSVAMASGSEAARSISQLVLLNSNFDSMPKVLNEGRRSINNIQRSSSLFLVKTIYSTLLAIIFLFVKMQYPFMPIQMTLTSMFTIGIPSFILALEPNNDRIKGNFFFNIISRAILGALTVVFNIIMTVVVSNVFSISAQHTSTLSVILTGYTGLMLLYKISKPFNVRRKILFTLMVFGFTFCVFAFKGLFSLATLTLQLWIILIVLLILASLVFNIMINLFDRKIKT